MIYAQRGTYFAPLERVPLLKLLLILILIHQDIVDPPHAVIEEQGVRFVIELCLRAKTRLVRQLGLLKLVHIFLHNVIHDAQREARLCVCGLCLDYVK